MIFTVTLNPAIDKTVVIPNFSAGNVNRIDSFRIDAGGKGFNVSKCLCKLGVKSTAAAILGGVAGEQLQEMMNMMGICTLSVSIEGQSRTNIKIIDPVRGENTDINEPGPEVSQQVLTELRNHIGEKICPDDIVILSGSLPKGVNTSLYREWTDFFRSMGAIVFMDADGEAMQLGIKARPYLIKPNEAEISRIMGKNLETKEELIEAGKKLHQTGICEVVISMGSEGAVFLSDEGIYYAEALKVPVRSTVSAGDSMVAAMAYGMEKRLPRIERIKLAIAISAASVMCDGTQAPEADLIWKLVEKVKIQEVK